jgi:predicted flap endonuclease-1-like 5' DNA nuclease
VPTLGSARPPPTDPVALVAELEHVKRVLASKLVELRKFQTERETLLARIAERDAKIRVSEGGPALDIQRLRARVAELEADRAQRAAENDRTAELEVQLSAARSSIRRLEGLLSERDTRIARLEQELSENLAWSSPPAASDLKKIKGIGPKYEGALRELGFDKCAQVAAWTEDDVAKVKAKLRVQKARVETWIELAKELEKKEI